MVHDAVCPPWLDVASLLDPFGKSASEAVAAYEQFVASGVAAASPWRQLRGQMWLGSERFLRAMEERVQQRSLQEVPVSHRHPSRPRPTEIIEAVGTAYRLPAETLFDEVLIERVLDRMFTCQSQVGLLCRRADALRKP